VLLTADASLGPYCVTGELGRGGLGVVYRARDPRLDCDVAIKVCAARFSERFSRETRAAAALNHPVGLGFCPAAEGLFEGRSRRSRKPAGWLPG